MFETLKDSDKEVKVYKTTVGELIKKLQEFNENSEVTVAYEGTDLSSVIIDVVNTGGMPVITIPAGILDLEDQK